MTSDQATQVTTALKTASSSILGDFITILPAVAVIIGALFVIKFVSYWLKKMKSAK